MFGHKEDDSFPDLLQPAVELLDLAKGMNEIDFNNIVDRSSNICNELDHLPCWDDVKNMSDKMMDSLISTGLDSFGVTVPNLNEFSDDSETESSTADSGFEAGTGLSPPIPLVEPDQSCIFSDLLEFLSNETLNIDDDSLLATSTGLLPPPPIAAVNPGQHKTSNIHVGAPHIIKRRRVSIMGGGIPKASSQVFDIRHHRVDEFNKIEQNPPLNLTLEELDMCRRNNITLPKYFPLTPEQDRNLKRVRRKIRNKLSAQDSRKRKKEFVDAMQDRMMSVSTENEKLQAKIIELEKQNNSMGSQLKRLYSLILKGGIIKTSPIQTTTTIIILLLSIAFFLIPGFKNQNGNKNAQLDVREALKFPPLSSIVSNQAVESVSNESTSTHHIINSSSTYSPSLSRVDVCRKRSFSFHGKNEVDNDAIWWSKMPYSDHDYALKAESRYVKKNDDGEGLFTIFRLPSSSNDSNNKTLIRESIVVAKDRKNTPEGRINMTFEDDISHTVLVHLASNRISQ